MLVFFKVKGNVNECKDPNVYPCLRFPFILQEFLFVSEQSWFQMYIYQMYEIY